MTTAQTDEPTPRKPLRLWPGVLAVAVQWLGWRVVPIIAPDAAMYAVIVGVLGGGLTFVVWWLFFSRAPWSERIGAIILMPFAVYATMHVVHDSIADAGMGLMLPIFSIPVLSLAFIAWAAATRRLSNGTRIALLVTAILLGCGVFTLVRTGGVSGEGRSDLHWRWTPSPEERLLVQAANEPAATSAPAAVTSDAEWPGFRGPQRDGIVRGVRIETDWSKSPPVAIWRRPVGPGWSSFAVAGDLLYTQEQRGEDELVSCYNLNTGEPVWRHKDAVRFWESNAGAGPRATPTLSDGRVYTMGATGIVNALDARDGSVAWSRDAASDTGVKIPEWGFTGSPLVVGDVVIIATSGRLAAYDIANGQPRWFGPAGGGGYSSPHLLTIDGVAQVLLLRGARTTSVAPADGTLLWEYSWQRAASIVQPAQTTDGNILITAADAMGGTGMRRIMVARGPTGWTVEERWTSRGLKPYFNDFVVHDGHAFGLDGNILACIDLADGARKWKGGRYGHGQLLLLADQDVLLVLSEEGELALAAATPDSFTELARFPAIEGKTWNHPVLVGDILVVRNDQELAAFRLSPAHP